MREPLDRFRNAAKLIEAAQNELKGAVLAGSDLDLEARRHLATAGALVQMALNLQRDGKSGPCSLPARGGP